MTIDLEMIGKDLNFKTEAPNDEKALSNCSFGCSCQFNFGSQRKLR